VEGAEESDPSQSSNFEVRVLLGGRSQSIDTFIVIVGAIILGHLLLMRPWLDLVLYLQLCLRCCCRHQVKIDCAVTRLALQSGMIMIICMDIHLPTPRASDGPGSRRFGSHTYPSTSTTVGETTPRSERSRLVEIARSSCNLSPDAPIPRSEVELFKENTDSATVLVPFTNIPVGTG
jgi:hypothetical protein